MEKQNLVGSLPKFGTKEVMSIVCEACQLGKQARHPFPAFKGSTHVVIPHNIMELLKGKTDTLQK